MKGASQMRLFSFSDVDGALLTWFVRWIGAGIFLAFLVPNRAPPWLNFNHEYLAALAFLPVVLATWNRGMDLPRMAWAVIVVALAIWVQYAFGLLIFAGDAWLATLYLAGGACVMAASRAHAGGVLNDTRGLVEQSLWSGLVLAGLASVAIALHQWLDLGRFVLFFLEMPPGGRPYANLGQPNHLASLCLLAVLGTWVLWEKRQISTVSAITVAITLVLGIVLSSSRTPLAAMIWLVPILLWARHCQWVRLPMRSTVAFLLLLLVLTLSFKQIGEWLNRPAATSRIFESMALFELRPEIWRDALKAISQSPWWGYGWHQVPVAQQLVADGTQRLGQLLPSFHNGFLDLTVWLGVPGALALLVVLGREYLAQFHVRIGVSGLAAWLGVAVVLNHAMLEYAQMYAYFWLPVCWWLGHLSVYTAPAVKVSSGPSKLLQGGLIVGCTVLLATVGWDAVRYQSAWETLRFREGLMDRSILVPDHDPLVLDQLDARLELAQFDPFAVPRENPPPMAAEAARRYPYPANLLKLAIIQATHGRPGEASDTLDLLCRMYRQWACESARTTWEVLGRSQIPELADVVLKPIP